MQEFEEYTPQQLIQNARKSKWFGINKGDVGNNLIFHNIGPKKQKDALAYNDQIVRKNFRRGLTLIQELDEDFKRKELKIARKGLRKFEYLYLEFLDQEAIVGKHLRKLKSDFLDSVDRFKGSYIVNVMEKANGQNCQISFTNGHWVICSKNGVLFVKKGGEIPWKDRYIYGFRLQIAQLWFEMINQMKPQLVQQLQKQLENKTIVGEYCDSINHQHIVKYSEKKIVFYAVVEKKSSENCLTVNQAFKFFQHFELKTAKIFMHKEVKSTKQLYQVLYDVYRNVTKASIDEIGEGGVVYIEGVNKNNHSSILSLWKIKSTEYLILRRLRQKLSQYLKKYRKSTKTILKKYTEQIKEMAAKFKTNQEIQAYVKLAEKSFLIVENGSNLVLKFVLSKFISFLEFVRKDHQKPVQEFDKMIKGATKQLQAVQVEDSDDQKQGKQKNNEKKEGSDNQESQLKQNVTEQITQQFDKLKLLKKRIIILIPLTIPASGKSVSFNNFIDSKDMMVEIVSSDKCRQIAMNQLKQKNKKSTHQQLFDKTAKSGKNLFVSEMTKAFNRLQTSKSQNCLLILDKNHPPSAIESTLKELKSIIGKYHKDVKIVALIPEITNPLEQKGKYSYPFSLEYFITCLKRVTDRQLHETLIGEAKQKANVLFGFASLYRGFRFNHYNLSKYFDAQLKVRMFNPEVFGVSNELKSHLTKIITSKKPGDFNEHPLVAEVVQLLKQVKINQISLEQLKVQNIEKVNKLFQNFDNLQLQKINKQQS